MRLPELSISDRGISSAFFFPRAAKIFQLSRAADANLKTFGTHLAANLR
jgi:hypothetical protein